MSDGPAIQSPGPSWWSLSYWTGKDCRSLSSEQAQAASKTSATVKITPESAPASSSSASPQVIVNPEVNSEELSGWERLRSLYDHPCMERDSTVKVTRMSFLSGFFIGGVSTYLQAKETYERSNVGRKYLSPSDAIKRRVDYAIARFAKSGFSMGFKCALISGGIVFLTTHLTAYRQRFSSWYFPALSGALAVGMHQALVGGVFTFPLGVIGMVKAVGLGVTSGLTLSAVAHLYALSIDKSVNEAYWTFKKEYDKELRKEQEWEERVRNLMKEERIWWKATAVHKLKKLDEESLAAQDA